MGVTGSEEYGLRMGCSVDRTSVFHFPNLEMAMVPGIFRSAGCQVCMLLCHLPGLPQTNFLSASLPVLSVDISSHRTLHKGGALEELANTCLLAG